MPALDWMHSSAVIRPSTVGHHSWWPSFKRSHPRYSAFWHKYVFFGSFKRESYRVNFNSETRFGMLTLRRYEILSFFLIPVIFEIMHVFTLCLPCFFRSVRLRGIFLLKNPFLSQKLAIQPRYLQYISENQLYDTQYYYLSISSMATFEKIWWMLNGTHQTGKNGQNRHFPLHFERDLLSACTI